MNIMYTGLDAVGVDQQVIGTVNFSIFLNLSNQDSILFQPVVNYNEWRLLYFIAFILLAGFFQ